MHTEEKNNKTNGPMAGSHKGGQLAKEICDILGIKHCKYLVLDFPRTGLFTATATVNIHQSDLEGVMVLIKKYNIYVGDEEIVEDITIPACETVGD